VLISQNELQRWEMRANLPLVLLHNEVATPKPGTLRDQGRQEGITVRTVRVTLWQGKVLLWG
jgi:hypothetical protein